MKALQSGISAESEQQKIQNSTYIVYTNNLPGHTRNKISAAKLRIYEFNIISINSLARTTNCIK